MKIIYLTQGQVAIVDDIDFDQLNKHNWYAKKGKRTFYAVRSTWGGQKRKIYMHREILGLSYGDGKLVDHINRSGLDNRRENLRLVTTQQNARRAVSKKENSFKGITYNKRTGKYKMQISSEFDTPEEAARAYDECAEALFKEFAFLNFKEVK